MASSGEKKQDPTKIKRKLARCLNILTKDYPNIQPSKEPTKFIFIGNAGLTTNADEISLTELISSVGCGLQAITLVPGKSYSFATFFNPGEAERVVTSANGQCCIRGSSTPVYISYINEVPSVSSCVKYEHPPGLQLFEEFISPKEEELLLNLIDWNESPSDKAEGCALKHRQVRHFGYEFQYGTNSVDKDHPLPQKIPEVLSPILNRIVEKGIMPQPPDQLTVNRYLPGQGIPPHVDTHCSFTDEILSLSAGSGITMDFRQAVQTNPAISSESSCHNAVYLKPRSLCAMTGSSRYEWTHGICPRMTDVIPCTESDGGLKLCHRQERISFTFRKIRKGVCACGNSLVCDYTLPSEKEETESTSSFDSLANREDAARLEKEHVLAVYDQIADHFSDTRHKPWPQVLEFVSSLTPGSFLLDVGCGNGKYLGHNKSVLEFGCDTSIELMRICNDRSFEVLNCNCLHLPYRDSLFDAVICIAVIHHLASMERRRTAVREMVRVLSDGGRGLIYVWALEQKRGKKKSAYLKQNKANRKDDVEEVAHSVSTVKLESKDTLNPKNLPVHTNRTEFAEQDMLVPWKLKPQNKSSVDKRFSNDRVDFHKGGESSKCFNSIHDKKIEENFLLNSSVSSDETKENLAGSNNMKEANNSVPVFHRFYHVFRQSELESLCKEVEGVNIVKSYYDEGNWCLIFEKRS